MTYDLILVLQQALEDCKRYRHFAGDERRAGDEELADFFEELPSSEPISQIGPRPCWWSG